MADQTSKSRRWELGLGPHCEELSSISKRTEVRKEKRKMQKQKKREMKMMEYQNKANYHSDVAEAASSTVVVVDYDLLVSQILSRLPAKSLMRCKCVCKAWKSTIEHDSHFINLHHTRSQAHPRFFIAAFPYYRKVKNGKTRRGYEPSFFSADLHYNYGDDGGIQASIDIVTREPKSMHSALNFFGPVRGLVCLIDRLYVVQICNVSTGQTTPWINSESYIVMCQKYKILPKCQFGYDPNTGKFKVVYVWTESSFKKNRFCEVLIVGDTRWRRVIDDVPQCEIVGFHRCAYVNGCVYWLTESAVDKSQSLLAFDIGSEKLRMIPILSFASCPRPCLEVIEMDGCITVIRVERLHPRMSPELKLWKFRDEHDKEEWTEEDIIIHCYISKDMVGIYFHPIPGKDQMILQICTTKVGGRWFCSYDLRNKTFSKFEIQGTCSVSKFMPDRITQYASYVESIFPVS